MLHVIIESFVDALKRVITLFMVNFAHFHYTKSSICVRQFRAILKFLPRKNVVHVKLTHVAALY